MMCARLLEPETKQHGRLYRVLERGFDGLLNRYEAGLKIVLRHRFITLMTIFGTIALTGYLYVAIPKGFFPEQDTGLIIGLSEAAQDISFQAMAERQQALLNAIARILRSLRLERRSALVAETARSTTAAYTLRSNPRISAAAWPR